MANSKVLARAIIPARKAAPLTIRFSVLKPTDRSFGTVRFARAMRPAPPERDSWSSDAWKRFLLRSHDRGLVFWLTPATFPENSLMIWTRRAAAILSLPPR